MSSYEKSTGKITPVKSTLHEITIEDWAEELILRKEGTLSKAYSNALEQLYDDPWYYDLTVVNNELYFVEVENEYDPAVEYCNVQVDEYGVVSFEALYYNGGTNWDELVESELTKIKDRINDDS
jgi:intein/homing endonuclease